MTSSSVEARQPVFLLSGFEPFHKASENPSELVVNRIKQAPPAGVDLRTVVLPVEFGKSGRLAGETVLEHRPDLYLALGLANRTAGLTVERVFINLDDARIKDNQGQAPRDQRIIEGAPDAYFTTLPHLVMLDALAKAGLPAERSFSAGTYVCNHTMYCALHQISVSGLPTRAGFVHLPCMPKQAARQTPLPPSMELDTMVRGVREMITALTHWWSGE